MKYKEFKEKFGDLDRKMLKLMLGIAPSKKEKDFSQVTIQIFKEGVPIEIIIDKETHNNAKMFLDARIIRRREDKLYLELKDSGGVSWGPMDNASILDLAYARKVISSFPEGIGKRFFELVEVVK